MSTERAAIRLYNEAIAATGGVIQRALHECRSSHEARAVYLSGRLSRLGGRCADAADVNLYGAQLASIPDEQALLLAALVCAEQRGRRFYRELHPESEAERSVLRYLRGEQERLMSFVERHLERVARRRHRSRPRLQSAPI